MAGSPLGGRADDAQFETNFSRGRKPRASREELQPRLARGPSSLTSTKMETLSELDSSCGSPVRGSSFAARRSFEAAATGDAEPEREPCVSPMRASMAGLRCVDDAPGDSVDRPEHPVAKGRRERASREEVERTARPPKPAAAMSSVQEV